MGDDSVFRGDRHHRRLGVFYEERVVADAEAKQQVKVCIRRVEHLGLDRKSVV